MTGTENRELEIVALLQAMNSRYVGERQEAERAFEQFGTEEVEVLLEIVRREADRTHRRRRAYRILATVFMTIGIPFLLFALVMMIYSLAVGDDNRAAVFGSLIGTLGGTVGGGVLGGFSFLLAPTPLLQLATRSLAKLNDVRVVGPLLELISSRMIDFNTRYSLATALMNLMPRLQVGDRELLTDRQLDGLYNCLRRSHLEKETDLVITCLDAIGKVGGSSALPHLERLVNAPGDSENIRRIRQKAQGSQEALAARIEQERQGMSLLRPAGSPDNPAETLLRPAQGAAPADPQVLLRASAKDETE
jgi:hypothetical protein